MYGCAPEAKVGNANVLICPDCPSEPSRLDEEDATTRMLVTCLRKRISLQNEARSSADCDGRKNVRIAASGCRRNWRIPDLSLRTRRQPRAVAPFVRARAVALDIQGEKQDWGPGDQPRQFIA